MSDLGVNVEACRTRQARLLEKMKSESVDWMILTRHEHIQYFIGPKIAWVFQPAALIRSDGHCVFVTEERNPPEIYAADELATYTAKMLSTMRNDQREQSTNALFEAIKSFDKPARVGVEFSACGPYITEQLNADLVDIDPVIQKMRRCKDADELAKIRKAIDGTRVMYERAREVIAPGVNELHVYNELQAAAVNCYGEMLTGTGNDYRAGARGGPPRDRIIEDGELYILDLGPAFRGYFADNARTFAVNGKPTDIQQAAYDHILQVFPLILDRVKPGVKCVDVFNEVQTLMDQFEGGVFNHHLGHGIGLFPHEAPHLNPNWDDTFEVGDVFTAEPGLYGEELRLGIRLENDYLVTEDGVENLSDFPMEL